MLASDVRSAHSNVRSLVWILALALGLRLYVAAISYGTNDIETWRTFARLALQHGVSRVYELHPLFNHPPLMGWYSAGMLAISSALNVDFTFVFKLVPIAADTLAVWLVYRIGRPATPWLLLFAINPANVLVSGFHGNTDCLCAMFCVASVYFGDRERPALSGLSLAAALNVKLIPVMLIVPLACSFRGRGIVRFILALGVGVIPFIPTVLVAWDAFRRNALQYNSFNAPWGLGLISSALDGWLLRYQASFGELVSGLGKPLILGGSALLGSWQLRFRTFSRVELAALATSWFLACSPGFGAQYIVYPAAFLALAPHTRIGFRYMYLAGLFAFLIYLSYWTGKWPLYASFEKHGYDLRTMLIGFVTWLTLLSFVVTTLRRGFIRTRWPAVPA
jgi:hypothetical protein